MVQPLDRHVYAAEVIDRVVEILKADLSAEVALINAALDPAEQDVPDPRAAEIVPRPPTDLSELVIPHQGFQGVWVRILRSKDHFHTGIGIANTRHKLEVLCFANRSAVTPGRVETHPVSSAYRQSLWLARAASLAVDKSLRGTAQVYDLRPGEQELPRRIKGMPDIHQMRLKWDVWQFTARALYVPGVAPTMTPAFGAWHGTTPGDTQVTVATVEEPVLIATTPADTLSLMSHASPGDLTVTEGGTYKFSAVATISHSANNTVLHIIPAINGIIQERWEQERFVSTGGDIGNMSFSGHATVPAGAVFSAWVVSDKNGTVTWEHLMSDLNRLVG